MSSASAGRYSELKSLGSRNLVSYSKLPLAKDLPRSLRFRVKPLRAVLNTSLGRSRNFTFILPRSRKGLFMSGRKLLSPWYCVSYEKELVFYVIFLTITGISSPEIGVALLLFDK